MARVLQIENYAVSTTINLLSTTGVCIFTGELDERPLKSDDGTVTRVFGFRVNAATKALSRAAATTFISTLRKAIIWNEDDSQSESWFLREAADGESPVRSLIMNFEAVADSKSTAVDPYQNSSSMLYLKIALTLQNHREAVSSIEFDTITSTGTSIGKIYTYSSSALFTAPGRIENLAITVGSSLTDKFWIGFMPYQGGDFQHLWELDNGTAGTDTVLTGTTAGKYSTNTTITNFTTTAMAKRLSISVYAQYTAAASTNYSQAKGKYVALLRYQLPSTNTVLARIGVYSGKASYNEARLLTSDGNWHFVNLGVVSIPGNGYRALTAATKIYALSNTAIYLDAQQLTGTGDLVMDTITFIPYESYIAISNGYAQTAYVQYIITHENLITETFGGTYTGDDITQWGTIDEAHNWVFPSPIRGVSNYTTAVIATERASGGQVATDAITTTISRQVVPAYEAYNG